ncbi:hypothetical protein PR048_010657 [Dryococelus australis]|uniref:Uncharacterized protein n=1 Tax=Dryococelus australis TaxID=614101 RepID=A0ABQ9I5B7_9NEOP|nr:hypothetical protein PR048_010657 [Dryococelus australis]
MALALALEVFSTCNSTTQTLGIPTGHLHTTPIHRFTYRAGTRHYSHFAGLKSQTDQRFIPGAWEPPNVPVGNQLRPGPCRRVFYERIENASVEFGKLLLPALMCHCAQNTTDCERSGIVNVMGDWPAVPENIKSLQLSNNHDTATCGVLHLVGLPSVLDSRRPRGCMTNLHFLLFLGTLFVHSLVNCWWVLGDEFCFRVGPNSSTCMLFSGTSCWELQNIVNWRRSLYAGICLYSHWSWVSIAKNNFLWNRTFRATVAERLACSPPTKASQVHSPVGSLDFLKWESCRTMLLVGGLSWGSLISPALSFWCRSILTSIILICSQNLAVQSHPNLFTHSAWPTGNLHFPGIWWVFLECKQDTD